MKRNSFAKSDMEFVYKSDRELSDSARREILALTGEGRATVSGSFRRKSLMGPLAFVVLFSSV